MQDSTENSSILNRFDSNTRDVINYLKNREEVCDLYIDEINGATKLQISEWEIKNTCTLPDDLKSFYMNHNGILIQWKCKLDKDTVLPLGKICVNGVKELTRVGSLLNKDYSEPSLFDLDDLAQSNDESSLSTGSDESELSDHDCHASLSAKSKKKEEKTVEDQLVTPRFDGRNFELDNCNGYGKMCLVYANIQTRNSTNNESPSTPSNLRSQPQIWYLDRSLTWHFIASSFTNYYRLLLAHLGLPQWPMLFTPDGLPPCLYQWYYLFAPGRILIQNDYWKDVDALKIIESENETGNSSGANSKKQRQSQASSKKSNDSKTKIDFSIFDEKPTKSSKSAATNQNTQSEKPSNPGSGRTFRSRSNPVKK